MRTCFYFVLALVMSVLTSSLPGLAHAADSFSVMYAYWDTEDGDGGTGLSLKSSYDIALPQFQIEIRGGYYDDINDGRVLPGSLSVIPIEVGAGVHLLPGFLLDPYASAGVGYYLFDGLGADNEVGVYAGLGVQVGMPIGIAFVVEGMYRDIDAFTVRDGASRRVFDPSGFLLQAGISLRF